MPFMRITFGLSVAVIGFANISFAASMSTCVQMCKIMNRKKVYECRMNSFEAGIVEATLYLAKPNPSDEDKLSFDQIKDCFHEAGVSRTEVHSVLWEKKGTYLSCDRDMFCEKGDYKDSFLFKQRKAEKHQK